MRNVKKKKNTGQRESKNANGSGERVIGPE